MSDSAEWAGTSEDPERPATGAPRARVSLGLVASSAALMVTIAAVRLLRDGSFWLDEASIAVNLLQQTPLELLGPYLTGHSFPRLYLLSIRGLMEALGYHTLVLRLLPFLALVGGVIAWHRLVYLRLRREPLLLALIVALNLIPGVWIIYSVMLKQYSLDVLLALVPFLLPDSFFDRTLGQGRDKRLLLGLPWLAMLSFTFVIPLLARLLGWYAWSRARGRRDVERSAAVGLGASFALAMTALWALDLRHTAGSPALLRFWRRCIPAESWSQTPQMVSDYFSGWYRAMPLCARNDVPEPLIAVLLGALALGVLVILRTSLRAAAASDPDAEAWGSRSLACVVCVAGLLAASVIVRYPLCPGRLTLFSLFSLQIITIEGIASIARWRLHSRPWSLLSRSIQAALLLLLLPSSYENVRFTLQRDTPENVRPLIPMIDAEPPLPILVADCSTRQLATLPEWLDREDVTYAEERRTLGLPEYPEAREFWVISAGSASYCPWFMRTLKRRAESLRRYHDASHTAGLFKVRMPEPKEP